MIHVTALSLFDAGNLILGSAGFRDLLFYIICSKMCSNRNNRNTDISERTQWDDIFPPLEYHRPGVELGQMVNSPRADASVEPLDNYASRLRRSSRNAKSPQQVAPTLPASQGGKSSCELSF